MVVGQEILYVDETLIALAVGAFRSKTGKIHTASIFLWCRVVFVNIVRRCAIHRAHL